MEKDKIYLIAIVLVIIISGYIYSNYNHSQISVGDTSFTIPNGFSIADDEMIGITNGTMHIFFNDTNKTDLNKTISEYINSKSQQNSSVQISHIQIKGYDILKSTIENNTNTIHYWFIKDGKVYEICTWTGNQNTDNVISDIL